MNYLAFDLGASSGKLFVGRFDGSRLSVEETHRFANGPVVLSGGMFWDYENIKNNMLAGIRRAVDTAPDIHSFGIDSFSNDFSFVSDADGSFSPLYCYRDARTARCRDAIYRIVPPEQLFFASGNQLSLFSTFMQLCSMRIEKTDGVIRPGSRLLFLPDLLLYELTGVGKCEYTIATVSQLFDYAAGGWSKPLLDALDLDLSLMPEIVRPGTVLGKLDQVGLSRMDAVSVCEHDTASAFLAACAPENAAIISSGTWALVGAENSVPLINDTAFRYNIANEGSLDGHHRLLKNVMGSWLLQKLRESASAPGRELSFSDLADAARDARPFARFIDPDDDAFFAPGDILREIRTHCRGGSPPETLGEFARCIYESLAFKYRWSVEKLETLTGRRLDRIHVVGGGSRDDLMNRFIADACGRPVIAGHPDASAVGNILVQMLAQKEAADISQAQEIVRRSFGVRIFEPRGGAVCGDQYRRYLDLFGLESG